MKEDKPRARGEPRPVARGGAPRREPPPAVHSADPARGALATLIAPVLEDVYWQQHFLKCPYVEPGARYEDYGPAYRYGVQACTRSAPAASSFDEAEAELQAGWAAAREDSRLEWHDARLAVRDAWRRARERIRQAPPVGAGGAP